MQSSDMDECSILSAAGAGEAIFTNYSSCALPYKDERWDLSAEHKEALVEVDGLTGA